MRVNEWKEMTDEEKDAFFHTVIDITPNELDQLILEFKRDNQGKAPNSIFLTWQTLLKIPARVKHIKRPGAKLVVIPFEGDNEKQFVISQQDPHQWGNLFYS